MRVIAEICVRLDGLPLAIELASARVRLLPPQALLARLSAHQLVILTGGARTLPERQQTLRNTLQWSYNLLSVEEQRLFRRLSVFDEGWTLEAVEAVCTVETEHRTLSMPSALDGVASLLDKSLLQRVEQESGEEQEPRFRMLVTVGEYGRVCLRESGEAEIIQRNHAAYFLALAERAEPLLKGAQQPTWLLRLEQERENLRAALTWFMERDEAEQALRLSGALWYFWYLQGDWSEGRRWLEAVLGLPSPQGATGERAKALYSAGELAYWQVDYSAARRLLEESIALYRALGDDRGLASPLGRLGVLLQLQGDLAAGGPLADESITLCRIHGNNWALCTLLSNLGWTAILKGDYTKTGAILQECLTLARELGDQSLIAEALIVNGFLTFLQDESTQASILLQEGLRLARESGHKAYIANALELLGFIALSLRDYSQATALFTEGFSLGKELGDKLILVWNLTGLALLAAAADEPHRAAHLFGVVEVLVEPHNRLLPPSGRAIYERTVATVRTQLGEEVFAKAMAEGRLMTPEQALAAKEPAPIQSAAPSAPPHMREAAKQALGGLTEREREVARLVAEGKANREIAEVLVVNYRTVEKHIENILSKLGFTSRAQIAVWAADKGLREKEQNSL
jgi:DNA-binding CsgD family transcriptional regulator/tetratricopeptide (TPR) repeat protein